MGVFEFEKFEKGTKAVMDAVVKATEHGAVTIIGKKKKLFLMVQVEEILQLQLPNMEQKRK
jgi:3-phosphoglycerate kinase